MMMMMLMMVVYNYTVNEMLQTWGVCRCWHRRNRCSWVVNATPTKTPCVVSTRSTVESSLFHCCKTLLQLIPPTLHSFADLSVTWPILHTITSQYLLCFSLTCLTDQLIFHFRPNKNKNEAIVSDNIYDKLKVKMIIISACHTSRYRPNA